MRRSRARPRLMFSTTVRPASGRAVLRRLRGGRRRPRANRSSRDWSMPNKMLVDATHPEETRVVVLRGHRVEEFDFESASRKQLRGNIYLAKVTRAERAERLAEPVREAAPEEEAAPDAPSPAAIAAEPIPLEPAEDAPAAAGEAAIELAQLESTSASEPLPTVDEPQAAASEAAETADIAVASERSDSEAGEAAAVTAEAGANITEVNSHGAEGEDAVVESVGGADALEEVPERTPRVRRQYKIQEVIKRRQVMLVQVVKEERGTKGAALTTYLSLAGRYSVLMPNTARGGGISRKITSPDDRRRLKEIAEELEVPEGMGVILRTAGASRTKTEVKRDFEYLSRVC